MEVNLIHGGIKPPPEKGDNQYFGAAGCSDRSGHLQAVGSVHPFTKSEGSSIAARTELKLVVSISDGLYSIYRNSVFYGIECRFVL